MFCLYIIKNDLNNLKAIRLTTNLSSVTTPLFSPDGKWIAYVGIEDGNTEVYLISSNGGGFFKFLNCNGIALIVLILWVISSPT